MIRVILHIGMGKTGTSSIQAALDHNHEKLHAQNTEYLGMWFDLLDPAYVGFGGQDMFLSTPAEDMGAQAARFVELLNARAEQNGTTTFVLSNEGWYGEVKRFSPFVAALRALCDVQVLVYARPPRDWLPSAYNQWMIYHKTNPGPIMSYAQAARQLLQTYNGIMTWFDEYGDILTLRPFHKGTDVVADFATHLGLKLDIPEKRTLERVEAAESVLRAYYNNRLNDPAFPHRFDNNIGRISLSQAPKIDAVLKENLSFEGLERVIASQQELFDEIRDAHGIDLLDHGITAPTAPDEQALRDRLLEQLVFMTMNQADRITELEKELAELVEDHASRAEGPHDKDVL